MAEIVHLSYKEMRDIMEEKCPQIGIEDIGCIAVILSQTTMEGIKEFRDAVKVIARGKEYERGT